MLVFDGVHEGAVRFVVASFARSRMAIGPAGVVLPRLVEEVRQRMEAR